MKTIYLLSFSILTAMSLSAQNVEPTHKHVSYGSHKDMKLNFWKIEAKKPTLLLKGNSFGRKYAHAEQNEVNMIQDERFKLATYRDGEILYDLKKDPEKADQRDCPASGRCKNTAPEERSLAGE